MRTARSKATLSGPRRPPRRSWALVALAGACYLVVLAVNRSLVEVRGPSMRPTLWDGERLVTVPARRGWLSPGQVVVVEDPTEPGHLVVKRLTGIGSGRVEVRGDDPASSTDSRTWGPVPVRAVRRIALRRWPDVRTRLRRQLT
jgi:nickel-type superoxide dismutase maturation protease